MFIFVGAGHTLSRRQRRAAEQAQNHAHCKLATISVVRGGILQSFEDVDAVLDRMDYMMQALQAFPAFMAQGPQHRQTGLALKFPRMTEAERDAALGIARHLSKGTLVAASAADLDELMYDIMYATDLFHQPCSWRSADGKFEDACDDLES